MVSPASTGLIQRSSRKPGDGPQIAIFSPRAAASLIWRWPSATSSFMQTDPTCQPDAAKPAEQRFAAGLLIEMKALRIELRGECLDGSAVKVNDPTSRRCPIAMSSKKRISRLAPIAARRAAAR